MHDDDIDSFWIRYSRQIKELIIIAGLLAFLGLFYKLPPYRHFLESLTRPVVKGILSVYSGFSGLVFRTVGFDLGLIDRETDREFLYRVQVAIYINERKAGPLLDIAMNPRNPLHQREMAIRGLLKFDSTSDWIQPFINELFKGGLIELDQRSPVLNDLFAKIREEGGIRNPLVRAYSEVVFAFMLQSVRDDVRSKSLGWVSDVMAEDAIFLIIPRLSREQSELVRTKIDQTLSDIRAISDRERAKEQLIPYFNKPTWPGMKFPIGIILARLGYEKGMMFVKNLEKTGQYTRDQEVALRVALARTPYPQELRITNKAELALKAKQKARSDQYAAAYKKQQAIIRDQMLAAAAATAANQVQPQAEEAPVLAQSESPLPPQLAKLMKEELPPDIKEPTKTKPTQPVQPAVVPVPPAKTAAPKTAVVPKAAVPAQETIATEAPPQDKKVELASLPTKFPPEVVPPPPPQMVGTRMKGVDIFFEVKKQDVKLYMNPGSDHPTGEMLTVGSKGKADFEVQIDEERWLQVKSRDKVGWINAAHVSAFNLTPDAGDYAPTVKVPSMDQGPREEATYFEPASAEVIVFSEPTEKSKSIGVLTEGNVYLALKSEKVGPDRWFQLELTDNNKGWARGFELQLADLVQAKIKKVAEEMSSAGPAKSAFAAEWVVAGVKGVLVYENPELSSKHLKKISPPTVFKVVETLENEYGEWYRIGLSGGSKEGWVQSMDVNLTKPSSN